MLLTIFKEKFNSILGSLFNSSCKRRHVVVVTAVRRGAMLNLEREYTSKVDWHGKVSLGQTATTRLGVLLFHKLNYYNSWTVHHYRFGYRKVFSELAVLPKNMYNSVAPG